jgi:hypothetical protein
VRRLRVDPAILGRFGYTAAVVCARDLETERSDAEGAPGSAGRRLRPRNLKEPASAHPHLHAWRNAFSAFGVKPSKFLCSAEALVKRVLKGEELPAINRVVDAYNAVSLRHVVPAGGEDLDRLESDLELTFSDGTEPFDLLSGDGTPESGRGKYSGLRGRHVPPLNWSVPPRLLRNENAYSSSIAAVSARGTRPRRRRPHRAIAPGSLPAATWSSRRSGTRVDPPASMNARRRWLPALAAAGIVFPIVLSRVLARCDPSTSGTIIFGLALHLFEPRRPSPAALLPAFIYAAKFANLFLHDDVLALTGTSVLSGLVAVACVFGSPGARRRRPSRGRRRCSSPLPTSWFYAGTPIPDTAGVAAAAAIWLSVLSTAGRARGRRRPQPRHRRASSDGLHRPSSLRRGVWKTAPRGGGDRHAAASVLLFWAFPVVRPRGVRPLVEPLLRQWRYARRPRSRPGVPRLVARAG